MLGRTRELRRETKPFFTPWTLCQVCQACGFADGAVLLRDGGVEHRHFPAAEPDHPRAKRGVDLEKSGAFQAVFLHVQKPGSVGAWPGAQKLSALMRASFWPEERVALRR